jgi:hypothetical protein
MHYSRLYAYGSYIAYYIISKSAVTIQLLGRRGRVPKILYWPDLREGHFQHPGADHDAPRGPASRSSMNVSSPTLCARADATTKHPTGEHTLTRQGSGVRKDTPRLPTVPCLWCGMIPAALLSREPKTPPSGTGAHSLGEWRGSRGGRSGVQIAVVAAGWPPRVL